MNNVDKLISIDEDSMDLVAGGTCIDPCQVLQDVAGAVDGLAKCAEQKVGELVKGVEGLLCGGINVSASLQVGVGAGGGCGT